MEWITNLFDIFLHLDKHLDEVIQQYQAWTYLILLVIIFCETGLVITPFLPGDSLLFAAGALAARPNSALDPVWLFVILSAAAIAGDTVNYWLGAYVGPKAFSGNIRFLKKEYLDRTHAFYDKYGGKTIIIARFVPIVRTFAPFVAGIGAMNYTKFIVYNVVGGIAWVAIFIFGGYWLARFKWVEDHFSTVIIPAIIIISVMPMVIEYIKARREKRK